MKKLSILLLTFALCGNFLMSCNTSSSNLENTKTESSAKTEDVSRDISIDEAKELIDKGEVNLILDVRNPDEFAEGHLKNAVLIPLKDLKKNIGEIEKFKDKLVLVYCRSGKRSADAIKILKENGFTNIVHMKDGIIKWDGDIEK